MKFVAGVDKNVGENYEQAIKNAPEIFGTGVAVGSVMQGGQNFIRSHVANKDRGGAGATRADNAVQNIIEVTKNYNGKRNNDFKYDNAVKINLETVSKELKKMSPEARKNYLDSIGVYKSAFDSETGAVKENSMPYTHSEAITPNLRMFSGNLKHKPLKGTESITNGAKTAKKTVERVIGDGATVVVTNELRAEDRAIYNPDDGVIYINNNADLTETDVAKAVALHEVTHTTEGTKAYVKLIKQIEAIANDKNAPESVKKIIGDITMRQYDTAMNYQEDMEYLSKEQAKYLVDTEVNADVIGDLLSDDYFIEKLAERDMGLLEKLYHSFKNRANAKKSELGPDGIKYLKKLASKFGTAIEKRAGGVKISALGDEDEEKKKSQEGVVSNERTSKSNDEIVTLQDVQVLRSITQDGKRKSINDFTSEDIKKAEKWALKFHKELGTKSPFFRAWFGDWRSLDATKKEGIVATVANVTTQKSAVEYVKSRVKDRTFFRGNTVNDDTGFDINIGVKIYEDTITYANREFSRDGNFKKYIDKVSILRNVRDIVKKSVLLDTAVIEHKNKNDNPNRTFMHVFYSLLEVDGEKYLVKLSVDEINSNSGAIRRAYNVDNIKISPVAVTQVYKPADTTSDIEGDNSFNYIISDLFKIVKQYDKNFNPKSASKVVNDDGTPKAVYHGTNAKFTVFDYDKTKLGKLGYGFYFTANKNFAKNYAVGDNLVEAYIDIKNPLIIEETVLTEKQIDSMLEKLSEFELKADGKNIQELKEELMSQETEISRNFLFLKIASKYQDILDNMGDVIGFDGIIDKNWDEYVVFSSNQIKSATDNKGTFDRDNPDIRYSRKRAYDPKNGQDETFEEVEGGVKIHFNDFEPHKSNDNSNDFEAAERARQESLDALLKNGEPPRYSPVSADKDTELLRRVVNNTKAKKYTRADVKAIVTELLSSEGYFGDNTVVMKGKKRAELEKMLWQALNTKDAGELGGAALDAAEYIIQNAIAVEYLEVTDDIQLAVQFVDALKPYLHNMNLDFIKGDIKAKLDKDKTPYLMWAVKKDSSFRGYTADEVAQELEALGFTIDKTNEADIFLEINELYRLAKQTITDAVPTKDTLLNALGTKKAKKLKQALAKDILNAQEEKGTETSFYKLQQKYIKQINELGEKVKTAHKRNTLENRILKEARRIADSNKHTFANATEVQTDALKNIKKLLSRVNSREQVNRSTLRAIMKELAIWYSEKNPVLQGFYDNYIAEHLAYFAESEVEETISKEEDNGQSRAPVPTIEISPDSELVERIKNSNKSKYTVIREYLIEKFYGQEFTLSDGKKAIMDKSDAKELSHLADNRKIAEISSLRDLVEKAVFSHKAEKVQHSKFKEFSYYTISFTLDGEPYDILINIGKAINDNSLHVYDITKNDKKRRTANQSPTGLSRDTKSGAMKNGSSTDSITEKTENVKREKPLSIGELEMVQVILHHMNHVFENFGKMWRGGKYVEASDVASAQYKVLEETENNISSFERVILHNKYVRYFMDPMAVLAAWDGHDPNGYFTTTYREFVEGLIGQRHDEMRALEEFDKFRKKNKKYFKYLVNGKDKITVSGRIDPRKGTVDQIEIPKNVAIDLYMVSKTGQAIVTLEEVGYNVRIDGQHKQETMDAITRGQIQEMYNKFSEQDKQLIAIMESTYNGIFREVTFEYLFANLLNKRKKHSRITRKCFSFFEIK